MNYHRIISAALAVSVICACSRNTADYMSNIPGNVREEVAEEIISSGTEIDAELVRRGVSQAAELWRSGDGGAEEFADFAKEYFAADSLSKRALFDRLSDTFEMFNGAHNDITVALTKPTYLDEGEILPVDYILGAYSPGAHFTDDMFSNRLAFITILNFPNWSLDEKLALGSSWSRLEWAYARMGDMFTSRVPAGLLQEDNRAGSAAENYIAAYNICMGHLLTEDGRRLFPEGMSLLSHWNLRDEIKSNYTQSEDALEKQEMIYKVMERIACQEIPEIVINNPDYDWKPFSNEVFKDGKAVDASREPDTRYQMILDKFHSLLALDSCYPTMPDAIQRNFDGTLEMNDGEIESLFTALLSSPQVKGVASVIRERLGRELRPFDIWYDGFKSRSAIPEEQLDIRTKSLYPDTEAFHKDTPRLLRNLGFPEDEAEFIASHVEVQDARGSGHAWECMSRTQPALLRTRVGDDGLDYKGYNIAVHEFGHNVEMVLDLYHIDHYMLFGVPNVAFTEAMAFLFQCRDLQLLGYGRQERDADTILDNFWEMYEIMGVSLVDMYMWRWLYENKDATARQLREKTIDIAHDVWNRYYEPVLGTHDSPVLAIYSHMVNSPMYLPNYPLGHLIHFEVEQHLAGYADAQEFAEELCRIYTLGRLTPDEWMRQAIGEAISIDPVLKAVDGVL